MAQTANPLNYRCAPNAATPEYVPSWNFPRWLAYGMKVCWLGSTSGDVNADCNFPRPVCEDDVAELRDIFLDLVETVVVALWKKDYEPGHGDVDGDFRSLILSAEDDSEEVEIISWYVRLDKDVMMFSMSCTEGSSIDIWLDYDAIDDREEVVAALEAARKTIGFGEVWDKLLEEAGFPTPTLVVSA